MAVDPAGSRAAQLGRLYDAAHAKIDQLDAQARSYRQKLDFKFADGGSVPLFPDSHLSALNDERRSLEQAFAGTREQFVKSAMEPGRFERLAAFKKLLPSE